MSEAATQKCLTAFVGKAFPQRIYYTDTDTFAYVFKWAVADQCVCVSHLPKVLMYFLTLRAIFRQIMYICQENPQIVGILQRLIAIR